MNTDTRPDPNNAHFHVYIDGSLSHVVPCGICNDPQDVLDAVGAKYDTELRMDIYEHIRAHMERALRLTHPDSQVSVY